MPTVEEVIAKAMVFDHALENADPSILTHRQINFCQKTIQVTIISQCSECESEIIRTQKEYSLLDFNKLNKIHSNYYYMDANGEYFLISKSICTECQI